MLLVILVITRSDDVCKKTYTLVYYFQNDLFIINFFFLLMIFSMSVCVCFPSHAPLNCSVTNYLSLVFAKARDHS